MKQAKKILVSFMTLALILTATVMSVYADEGSTHPGPHFEAVASAEAVNVGDTFTVKVSSSEMTVKSVYGGIVYDSSKVEVKNVEVTDLARKDGTGKLSMTAQEGQNSNVGFYSSGTDDFTYSANPEMMTVTFEAKAAGTVQFALYEDVDGTDEYYAELTQPYGPVSIVINGQVTPEDPEVITLVSGDGTRTVLKLSDIKAAESVTTTFRFTGKGSTTEATGTFYSMKDILEKANIDVSNAHGLKAVGRDGFVTGYTVGNVDDLYIFDMGEVISNGQPMGEAGKFRTAIDGSAGNKWASDVVTFEVANDHVWFFKGGACKHYCAICNEDEPSITLVVGEQEITVHECEIKAAEKVEVSEEDPWTFKNGQNKGYGTFYSVKSILENANVDYSEAHGLKAVARDGFVTGFTKEEIETLYIFDMAEVNRNGSYGDAGTFGTAINGSAGNKWATDVVKAEVADGHVWFFKKGACLHYCAICGEDEPSITLIAGEQEIKVHECEIKAAESVTTTFSFTGKGSTTEATGTFYSMKDILEKANIDVSNAHGLKAVASDGFVTGYTVGNVDDLYILDMGEVISNGQPMGEAGKFRTAIDGSAGNKWASDVVTFEVANDHVWFFKGGACKHYCAICNEDEPSITLVVGEQEITVHECEIKAAEKVEVTEEDPWTFKNGQNKGYGTFCSVKSILENANVDYSEAHGLKAVSSDGFVTGFTKDEIETLYIFDMAEVNRNGSYGEAGTFGTAINGSAGNKWATDVVKAEVANDHVWFFKGGVCKHYCAICNADEPEADYSAVKAAKAKAEAIDQSKYTEESYNALLETLEAIQDGKKACEQADVDAMAILINNAIDTLEPFFEGITDDYTGIAKGEDGAWYYLQDGEVDFTFNGVESNAYGWWRIENGKVNFQFNGLAANEYGTWYLKDGKVDFNYTGFAAGTANEESGWWYVEKGQVKFNKTDILSGKANTEADKNGVSGWWYVLDGKVFSGDTVAKNANGWWAVRNGKVDFNYTGFAKNNYGWWYVEKGQVTFKKNDIIKGKANTDVNADGVDGWWYVKGSQVIKTTTVDKNAYGWWFIKDGQVDFTYNGVESNANGWWCIHKGQVDFNYTGFEKNDYGWWYIEKGQVTFKKNDIISGKANTDANAAGEDGWWLVKGSQVKNETTVAQNSYGWWYVYNGKVDFTYKGFADNDYGTWYIENGKVDFSFNGSYNDRRVINGKAQ